MNANDPRNIFVNNRENYEEPQKNAEKTETETRQTQSQSSNYEQRLNEMKRLAEKYQKEGENQLVKDIVNSVLEQKAKGQLTNEQLLTFTQRVSPLLNAEQKQRLDGLMQELLKL